jgi:hypothetical protein
VNYVRGKLLIQIPRNKTQINFNDPILNTQGRILILSFGPFLRFGNCALELLNELEPDEQLFSRPTSDP